MEFPLSIFTPTIFYHLKGEFDRRQRKEKEGVLSTLELIFTFFFFFFFFANLV